MREQAWQMADRLGDANLAFTSTWSSEGSESLLVRHSWEAQRWYQRELASLRGRTQAPFYRRILLACLGGGGARACELAGAQRLCTGAVHTQEFSGGAAFIL